MSVRFVETVDTHTLGEPTRIVVGGFPRLRGATLKARARHLLGEHSALRKALMWEPRGHAVMFGAVVVPPVRAGADVGLVFMDGGGTVDMCVHGTIGAATALVELGRLQARRGGELGVDTPAGLVRVRLTRSRRRVVAVELEGVAARSVARGLKARVAGRTVPYDLAYAGNLVAIAAGEDLGVEVAAERFDDLVARGHALKARAQRAWAARPPRSRTWPEVVSALVYARLGRDRYRDLVVFRDRSFDRSPCGSCVGAFMAGLHAAGSLALDRWIECSNLLGLAFRGKLVERRGELVPWIGGSAFITGEHRFRIDSRDPLKHGFQLG